MSDRGPRRMLHMLRQLRLAPRRIDLIEQLVQRLGADLNRIESIVSTPPAPPPGPHSELIETLEILRRLEVAVAEAVTERTGIRAAQDGPVRDLALAELMATLGPATRLEPGLGVHIPCWNHRAFVGQAIASALQVIDRTGGPGEVLVFDDASDDGSGEVLAAVRGSDPRIRVITAGVKVGLVRLRNAGYHAARYRHALMLDADNLADPNGVAALLTAAKETGATVAYGPVLAIDPDDGTPITVVNRDLPSAALLSRTPVDTLSVRDVQRLRELGGQLVHPQFQVFEDYALLFRLLALGEPIVHVPMITGRYRLLTNRHSASQGPHQPIQRHLLRAYTPNGKPRIAPASRMVVIPGDAPPSAEPATRRVLILSSGGVSNLGDDAILVHAVDRVRTLLGPDVEIAVATDGTAPLEVGREYIWLGTLHEMCAGLDPADVCAGRSADLVGPLRVGTGPDLLDLARADVAILVGGGSLTTHFAGLAPPRAALSAAFVARGIPFLATGQGIGPFTDEVTAGLAAAILGRASTRVMRDHGSARLAIAIGVAGADVAIDDAAGLRIAGSDAVAAALRVAGCDSDRPYIVANLRAAQYGANEESLARWADQIDAFAASHDLAVVGVPIARTPAAEESIHLIHAARAPGRRADWFVTDPGRDVRLIAGLIGGAAGVVASSFHASLFAVTSTTPVAILTASDYQRGKAQGLVELMGLSPEVIVDADRGGSVAAALAMPGVAAQVVGERIAQRDALLAAALRGAGFADLAVEDRDDPGEPPQTAASAAV